MTTTTSAPPTSGHRTPLSTTQVLELLKELDSERRSAPTARRRNKARDEMLTLGLKWLDHMIKSLPTRGMEPVARFRLGLALDVLDVELVALGVRPDGIGEAENTDARK